jgi:hypothetical protein
MIATTKLLKNVNLWFDSKVATQFEMLLVCAIKRNQDTVNLKVSMDLYPDIMQEYALFLPTCGSSIKELRLVFI